MKGTKTSATGKPFEAPVKKLEGAALYALPEEKVVLLSVAGKSAMEVR